MKALKVIAISDFHSTPLSQILSGVEADLLLIAGDWSYKATWQEIANFKADLIEVRDQFDQIVMIHGNHELGIEAFPYVSEVIERDTGVRVLQESGFEFKGRTFWGSPATPYFGGWAFNYQRGEEIARIWEQIPENLDVLLTHGPPYGILDTLVWNGEHVGCEELRKRLDTMENPPKAVVFGHIHHWGGQSFRHKTPAGRFIDCYNVSICTESYDPTNPITEFYI